MTLNVSSLADLSILKIDNNVAGNLRCRLNLHIYYIKSKYIKMRDQILDLILKHPKHYAKLIKRHQHLLSWVTMNSLVQNDHLPTMIYSAVHQESNICKNGKTKKFTRFSTGFSGCGPASTCACTRENIAANVSATKQNYTEARNSTINRRREETMLIKYGHKFNSQRGDIKHIWTQPKIPLIVHEKLTDQEWLSREYNQNQRSLTEIADELGVYYSTVGDYCQRLGFAIRPSSLRSLVEIKIADYVKSLGFEISTSDRSIIAPKEIDILVPGKNFAIEVNGLRWHSYNPAAGSKEKRTAHSEKTQQASAQGIALMHITDWEWQNQTEIIQSMIKSRLGLNQKIAGRKCQIQEVGKQEEREFLTANHLQGAVASSRCFGLYHQNMLMMLISLGRSRFKRDADYEVLRMCTRLGYTVVGGVSKLAKHLRQELPGSTVVSYCDLSKSQGTSYIKAGFSYVNSTGPGYFWTDGTQPISRYKCQKKNLPKWLPTYDAALSEAVNMFAAGYRRYWDCGNAVMILHT